jgi:UDP-GlcNAc:undecaprenyl-phosphate/decaprenyl-phosphate GlcNAc-1-phosphate transferase
VLYGIAAATSALLLATLLAAVLRVPLLRAGVLDRRRARPVPLLGGAAVVTATCAVAGAGNWTGVVPLDDGTATLLYAAGGVAALGAVADVWRLRARFLAVGTAVAAALVVPYGETGVLAGAAAAGWIVAVTLAFRGLDHADGLAGSVGVVTAFGAGACAAAVLLDGLAVLLCVLAAALTGFLMHNWPPARAGLGASGSLFTGFLLASAGVLAGSGGGRGFAPGAAVLFGLGAVAVADTVLVTVSRVLSGRPLLRDGPDHVAHRLRRLGVTPAGAVVLVGVGVSAGVAVAVLIHTGWLGAGAALWAAGGALAAVLGLLRVSPYGRRDSRTSARLEVNGVGRTSARLGVKSGSRTNARLEGRGGSRTGVRLGGGAGAEVGVGAGVGADGVRRPRDPRATGAVRATGAAAVTGAARVPARAGSRPPVPAPVTPARAGVRPGGSVGTPAEVTRSTPRPPSPRSTTPQTPSSAPHCV